VLLKLLNNIGIIGAILAGIADVIFVIIFVVGVKIDVDIKASIIFATINALVGILINVLLRYQGQKYAEIENQELCDEFYRKKVKENKKYLSMSAWQGINVLKDILIKGATTVFGIFGIVYISIEGSKNPIQILITLVTLILFACFGLMSMNSSYCRFYNVQVPYMEIKIKEKGDNKNGTL
jgi:hypothetical protein